MTIKKLPLTVIILSIQLLCLCGQSVSLDQNRVQIPVLKNKSLTPALQIKLNANDEVDNICLEFDGTTNLRDIDSVFLVDMGENDTWNVNKGSVIAKAVPSENHVKLSFTRSQTIVGKYFIVAVQLSDEASLDHYISLGVKYIEFADSTSFVPQTHFPRIKQHIGLALRQGGDDGVVRYRIPGLARTNDNTLLAVYDIRHDSHSDLQGNIDIGVSRSTDGGLTWEAMRTGLDMGQYGGLPQKYNGVSDANILVDKNSNDIYLAGCWMSGVIDKKTKKPIDHLTDTSTAWNHQWYKHGSLQGYDIDKTAQFMMAKSTDDGRTWGDPVNITRQVKRKKWHLLAPAPGSAITLDDSTLVFPTQGKNRWQKPFSSITYSKDGGQSWQTSKPSYRNTTENMVVQLSDGRIMQNMRDNRNKKNKSDTNGRAIFTTKNLGKHWTEHNTHHYALHEPVCMASIYKHSYVDAMGQEQNILLFSNPNSKCKRERMTIKVSLDDGQTWPQKYWILLDELELNGGYSSITSIDNNTIGILYEGSQAQMTFQRIYLDEFGIMPL